MVECDGKDKSGFGKAEKEISPVGLLVTGWWTNWDALTIMPFIHLSVEISPSLPD